VTGWDLLEIGAALFPMAIAPAVTILGWWTLTELVDERRERRKRSNG